MEQTADHHDFFVSYNGADQGWAEWIAWVLEENGYSVKIQAWDFRPGTNFVLEMDRAAKQSDRTIVVLSPNYLGSNFAQPEWAAAFAGDAQGLEKRIVPVMVEHCEPEGLLAPIAQIRLVGLARDVAASTLLAGVKLERAKPDKEPSFPGGTQSNTDTTSQRSAQRTVWSPLTAEPPSILWQGDHDRQLSGPTTVEVHLLPLSPVLIESRQLAAMPDALAKLGRDLGLFGTSDGLDVETQEDSVSVRVRPGRSVDDKGLRVTRGGQCAAWNMLPHDMLGSVLDPNDLKQRLANLLQITVAALEINADAYAFGLALNSVTTLAVGDSSQVGHRNSTSMHFYDSQSVRIEPDAQVQAASLSNVEAIAEELTARLMARISSQQ